MLAGLISAGVSFTVAWKLGEWYNKSWDTKLAGSITKLDAKLMEELANSGVKYNPDDVVMITKTSDGKLVWLETGNDSTGLKHIVNGHAADFTAKGIDDIPGFLAEVLQTTPVKTGSTSKGLFAEYIINGNRYRVAYGTNGYIVSFYPIKNY